MKFIFSCGREERQRLEITGTEFAGDDYDDIFQVDPTEEANLIRWFFRVLFVRSILQVVSGEDEIWMIESGMENRLHIWRMGDA